MIAEKRLQVVGKIGMRGNQRGPIEWLAVLDRMQIVGQYLFEPGLAIRVLGRGSVGHKPLLRIVLAFLPGSRTTNRRSYYAAISCQFYAKSRKYRARASFEKSELRPVTEFGFPIGAEIQIHRNDATVCYSKPTSGSSFNMNFDQLESLYSRQKELASQAAGDLTDIPRRAVLLNEIYLDSGENHTFSQIAAHGALWAYRFFEVGGRLGRIIAWRYFYNSRERAFRLGLLNQFAEGFREVNRLVFIDTFTNYYFTREYGREAGADQLIQPSLLEALNRVHQARQTSESLSAAQKKEVFEQSFFWEQELTVAPGVQKTVAQFECPIMVALCTKPFVRFAFFPALNYILFRNFADKAERIDKGMRAYDMAARRGWVRVVNSLRDYRLLPGDFFASPRGYAAQLVPVGDPIDRGRVARMRKFASMRIDTFQRSDFTTPTRILRWQSCAVFTILMQIRWSGMCNIISAVLVSFWPCIRGSPDFASYLNRSNLTGPLAVLTAHWIPYGLSLGFSVCSATYYEATSHSSGCLALSAAMYLRVTYGLPNYVIYCP